MIIIYELKSLNLNRPVSKHSVEDCAHAVVRHLSHDHDQKNVCPQNYSHPRVLVYHYHNGTTTMCHIPLSSSNNPVCISTHSCINYMRVSIYVSHSMSSKYNNSKQEKVNNKFDIMSPSADHDNT